MLISITLSPSLLPKDDFSFAEHARPCSLHDVLVLFITSVTCISITFSVLSRHPSSLGKMFEDFCSILRSVCVFCVLSSRSFWTSSSLDVPAGVTQEEGHTGFLIHLLSAVRALIFLARRIQPFLSLVDREVEFCVLTI